MSISFYCEFPFHKEPHFYTSLCRLSFTNQQLLTLVPEVISCVLFRRLQRLVDAQYDPMSSTQTTAILQILRFMIDTCSVSISAEQYESLLRCVIQKFNAVLDEDIYIPLYEPNSMFSNSGQIEFFDKQLQDAVSLLANFCEWYGYLKDDQLRPIAIGRLLNRVVLVGVGCCLSAKRLNEALKICESILKFCPESWLCGEGEMLNITLKRLKEECENDELVD
ncbi:hypothetical protein ACOME3_008140 [Neoechinorhynchus agilis]